MMTISYLKSKEIIEKSGIIQLFPDYFHWNTKSFIWQMSDVRESQCDTGSIGSSHLWSDDSWWQGT